MGYREQLERKIAAKRRERDSAQESIRRADAYIAAWEEALKMLPRDRPAEPNGEVPVATVTLRRGSDVAKARGVILVKKQPMHVSELVKAIGREDTRGARAALASSLAAYCRKEQIFVRTEPNTFGLAELGHKSGEGLSAEGLIDSTQN